MLHQATNNLSGDYQWQEIITTKTCIFIASYIPSFTNQSKKYMNKMEQLCSSEALDIQLHKSQS